MGKASGEPGFFQIIFVIGCGVALLLFITGKMPRIPNDLFPKNSEREVDPRGSMHRGTIIDKLVGSGGKHDELDRSDRKELDDLLEKIGH